jgi:hypothetical protein
MDMLISFRKRDNCDKAEWHPCRPILAHNQFIQEHWGDHGTGMTLRMTSHKSEERDGAKAIGQQAIMNPTPGSNSTPDPGPGSGPGPRLSLHHRGVLESAPVNPAQNYTHNTSWHSLVAATVPPPTKPQLVGEGPPD